VPTWGEILNELAATPANGVAGGPPDFDKVRRKYLAAMHALTGRDVILYASDWLSGSALGTIIVLEDMLGMMETCRGLKSRKLDLILHSPGGDPNATSSLVRYLRGRFDHIRAFVPLAAMSAATMWALAADEIWMGAHSQLGPIDPQMVTGNAQFPARAILEQFERAKVELEQTPAAFPAWVPILQAYGPSLLQECTDAEELSKRLVRVWLRTWMLKNRGDRSLRAARIATYFADYSKHRSHGVAISRDDARSKGVIVRDLEDDPQLQDAVLSIHHSTMHTFSMTAATKIVENHLGRAWVKAARVVQMTGPGAPGQA
jgi:hypothetical protein